MTCSGQERSGCDRDAAAGPVEQDYIGERACPARRGAKEDGRKGDVPEAEYEGVECRQRRGEVWLVDVAGAWDLDQAELMGGETGRARGQPIFPNRSDATMEACDSLYLHR